MDNHKSLYQSFADISSCLDRLEEAGTIYELNLV